MLFSRENPLVKSTAPESISYHIKNQKYLDVLFLSLFYFVFVHLTTSLTRCVASICYLCACVVYIVLLGSPTDLITLVSSPRVMTMVAVLHHPFLFGEIPT